MTLRRLIGGVFCSAALLTGVGVPASAQSLVNVSPNVNVDVADCVNAVNVLGGTQTCPDGDAH